MTITHRPKPTGSALSATVETNSQIDDKEPPKYHCDACSNDVTNTVRIKCADKDCPDFDLCVTCFCSGSEPVKHKTWHEYRVVKPHTFPIFSEDWDADEELLLIQGAEKNGIGNWQAIADYVGTRSKQECEQHYLEVYVSSSQWPLPLMDRTFNLTESECIERKRQRLQISRSPRKPPPPVISGKPITSQPTFHEIQGYMPKRFEFETEHENEAEQHVKDMVFNDDDTQEEIDLKVMVLDIYNSRLDKRQERKQLIFERGWLEFKRLQSMDRKRQREEREVYNKTRIFCRLQSSDDYDMFVQGLIREQHLRDRMATLTEWRRAGLSTLRQGDQYERDKQQRLNHLKTVAALSNDRVNGPYQRSSLRAQMAALAPCSGAVFYKDKYLEQPSLIKKKSSSSLTITNNHNNKNQLNIAEADGYHLLTKEEEDICSNLHILPRPYLVIKDLALKSYAKQGFLKRKQFRDMIKIDINKANKIFDFFVENGWIKYWQDPAEIFAAQQWELQQQQFLQFQQFQQQLEEQAAAAAAAMMDSNLLTDPAAAMNIDESSLLNSNSTNNINSTNNNNINNNDTNNNNNNTTNTINATTADLTTIHNDLLSTTGTTDASSILATTIDMANTISAVVTNNNNDNDDNHSDINTTASLLQGNQILSENMINTSLATLDSALLSTINDSMVLCSPDVTTIDMSTTTATTVNDETTTNKTTDNNDKENKNIDKTNNTKQEQSSTADTIKNPIITTTTLATTTTTIPSSPSDTSTSQPTDITSTETKTTVLNETMKE